MLQPLTPIEILQKGLQLEQLARTSRLWLCISQSAIQSNRADSRAENASWGFLARPQPYRLSLELSFVFAHSASAFAILTNITEPIPPSKILQSSSLVSNFFDICQFKPLFPKNAFGLQTYCRLTRAFMAYHLCALAPVWRPKNDITDSARIKTLRLLAYSLAKKYENS
jgi:hypothetical protein